MQEPKDIQIFKGDPPKQFKIKFQQLEEFHISIKFSGQNSALENGNKLNMWDFTSMPDILSWHQIRHMDNLNI